jgi:two-component system CheB/CheR fusion protein
MQPQRVNQLLTFLIQQTKYHAFILLDREGRIIGWLGAAERLFGYTAEEVIGQPAALLFTPEELALGLAEHELRVASTSFKALDDRWLARKDGTRFWASAVLVPLRDERGEVVGYGKIIRDRTDWRGRHEALQNRIETLTRETHRKEQFLSIFVHEIRNHLHPLQLALHLLRSSAKELPGHVTEYLEQVEGQMETMRRLITDLHDVTRIGAGGLPLERETINLNEILRQARETCLPLAEERRQELQLLLPPSVARVRGDAKRLRQAFGNLIHNAIRFTPEGGAVWIKMDFENGRVVVRVEDNGQGIEHELLAHIFELFTQATPERNLAERGAGIGLWLARNLVALHGGAITVRSEGKDCGSEFTVSLPYESAEPEPRAE